MLPPLLALTLLLTAGGDLGEGVIVGRFVVQEGARPVDMREVRKLLTSRKLSLELREGMRTLPVQLSDSGDFVARGPAGRYRFEYVLVGNQAEYVPPQWVRISEGRPTCVGTFRLSVRSVASDLGNNTGSTFSVEDACKEAGATAQGTGPDLGTPRVELAQPGDTSTFRLGLMDFLTAFRAEYDLGSDHSTYRVNYVLALKSQDESRGWLVGGSAGESTNSQGHAFEGTLGAGYRPFSLFEAMVGAGFRQSAPGFGGGVFGLATLRLGFYGFGIGGRGELGAGAPTSLFLTLDVSPVYVLGSLL
jgi:hypothetical protein